MKILIADDDRVWRRLLEVTLRRLGHEVVSVADGAAATAALLEPDGPRLAILDWMMPVVDGLSVCRAVRQRPAPYVYIILLTARDRAEDLIEGLDAEADDYLTKPFESSELKGRLRSGQRVLKLQEDLLLAHEVLRYEANHDRLTGLWNRGMILDQLSRELTRSGREGAPLSAIIADVDRFKRINDTLGHPAGDRVLHQTGRRLQAMLRASDCIGRYGGEEFLIVLPNCDAPEAGRVAERMRDHLAAKPLTLDPHPVAVTASFGVASTTGSGLQLDALIAAADEALYRAKADGRNRVELHSLPRTA